MSGAPFTRGGWLSKRPLHVNFCQPKALSRTAYLIMAILFLDHGVVIYFPSGFANSGGEWTLLASPWEWPWPFFVCSGKAGCQWAVLKSHFHLHSGQYLPHFGLCSTQCKWFLRATLAAKKSDIVFNFWHCHSLNCRRSCSRPPGLDGSG